MNKQRIIYFDYLRIAAIFSVVVLHVVAKNWIFTDDVNSFEWQTLNFYDSIVRWGVPVFVMISGALFLGKNQSIKKLYTKNILRIVVSFLCWSILYVVWNSVVFEKSYSIREMLLEVLFGHYHLWFLFMITGLYIIVPLLNQIVADKKTAWYFVIVAFIFTFLIPQGTEIIGLKFSGISNNISELISKLELHMVLGYSGYFVLGYLLNNIEIKKKHRIIIYILGVLGLIFTLAATSFLSLLQKSPADMFFEYLTVNTFLVSVSVFVFAKTHWNKPMLATRRQNLLLFFSKCSFGVYLIHPLIIESLEKLFNITPISFNPIFSVPVLSLTVFLISLLISAILNGLPIVKKWIV